MLGGETSASRAVQRSSPSRRRGRRHGRRRVVVGHPRRSTGESLRERVLLVLPVGRSPPRGARPRGDRPRAGRARAPTRTASTSGLARAPGHPCRPRCASSCETGRPPRRDRRASATASAIGSSAPSTRGTDGVRRGIVLGVVLGEDEGLPARRAGRLPRIGSLPPARRLRPERRVPRRSGSTRSAGSCALLAGVRVSSRSSASICAYVLAVGWQPSVVRAGVAGALASLAWLAARPRDRWHFLALGALVLLLWTPTSLPRAGLPALVRGRRRDLRRRAAGPAGGSTAIRSRAPCADALAVALACGAATAPIVLFHFGEAPLYTVLANVARRSRRRHSFSGSVCSPRSLDPVSPSAAAALAGSRGGLLRGSSSLRASWPTSRVREVGHTRDVRCGCARRRSSGSGCERFDGCIRHCEASLVLGVGAALLAGVAWLLRAPGPCVGTSRRAARDLPRRRAGGCDPARDAAARVLVDQGPPEADVAGSSRGMGVRSLVGARAHAPAARSRRRRSRRPPALEVGQRSRPGSRRIPP